MTAPLTVLATAAVRTWTLLYTGGTPAFVRDGRRQEIESDLWEHQHDLAGEPDARVAAHIMLRLLSGVLDDVRWRLEHRALSPRRTQALVATIIAIVVGAAWVYTATAQLFDEQPPPIPSLMMFVAAQPPPPPPPPPPRPLSLAEPASAPSASPPALPPPPPMSKMEAPPAPSPGPPPPPPIPPPPAPPAPPQIPEP